MRTGATGARGVRAVGAIVVPPPSPPDGTGFMARATATFGARALTGPTPPVITAGPTTTAISATSATLTVTANQVVQGWFEYGPTTGYGSESAHETSFNYSTHIQTISGLAPSTLYHLRFKATSQSGQVAYSSDYTFTTAATAPSGFPPDTTLTNPAVPALTMPAYLATVTDPTWGTKIIRVSNTAGLRHAYSRISAWNYDGTRILQYLNNGQPCTVINGTLGGDYAILRTGRTPPADFSWSNTNADTGYGVSGSPLINFVRWTESTNSSATLHTFTGYSAVRMGWGEGQPDNADKYCALWGTANSGGYDLMRYDIQLDAVVTGPHFTATPDNFTISSLGTYIIVNWGSDDGSDGSSAVQSGVQQYNAATGAWVRRVTPWGSRHGEVCLAADGTTEQYINHVGGSPGTLNATNLTTGAATALLTTPHFFTSGHSSARNIGRPGWLYVSGYDGTRNVNGRDQLVAVKTDGSLTVEVFADAHMTAINTAGDYLAQPHMCVSPDGKRIIWAARWDNTGNIYDFVAGMNV